MKHERLIGDIIKYIRTNSKLTQQELAEKLYIGRTTLSDYEREKTDINFDIINNICKICEYEIIFRNKNTNEEITVDNIKRKL